MDLTLRQVVSKVAPVLGSMRLDTRKTFKLLLGWDNPMPEVIRNKWIWNFRMLEELRGLGFRRAMMAEDAVNSRARAIVKVDAALGILMMSVYIGFERLGGGKSCQLLIS